MIEHRHQCRLMGSAFELIIADDDEAKAQQWLKDGVAEIQRIEQLLTEFNEGSITSLINRSAGLQPIHTPTEVYDLIARSLRLSALTQGAFDISIGALKPLYNFKKGDYNFPPDTTIQEALSRVGYRHISLLPDQHIAIDRAGLRISFAAIGKGYAADCVKKRWLEAGVKSGVVNASGDLTVIGTKADGNPWQVGIANPDQPQSMLLYVPLHHCSVATSGDYEQYFMRDGIRYSHTLNPLTGYPLTGVKSVTIFSPSAELCDALATAVYVMGAKVGLHLIEQLPTVQAIVVDGDNKLWMSAGLRAQNKM